MVVATNQLNCNAGAKGGGAPGRGVLTAESQRLVAGLPRRIYISQKYEDADAVLMCGQVHKRKRIVLLLALRLHNSPLINKYVLVNAT